VIRAAKAADIAAIAALEEANLGVDAWSEALVAEGVSGRLPTVHYLVAEVAGEVVGHAAASIVADIAELQRIAVDRAHRRTGLATALLEQVRRLAVEAGADRLLLEVREDNAGAITFYEAQGFAELARRRLYYRDGATAVVLSLGLERRDGAVGG
jgi:ribosomal-protein-alanine N-acetyltransferase